MSQAQSEADGADTDAFRTVLRAWRAEHLPPDVAAAGAAGSLAKLSWAFCDQELGNLAVDLIGPGTLGAHDHWAENFLAVRQASIAGGTTEINKNIVGEHVLGLPR